MIYELKSVAKQSRGAQAHAVTPTYAQLLNSIGYIQTDSQHSATVLKLVQ